MAALGCASGGGKPVAIPLLEATIAPTWAAAQRPRAALVAVERDAPPSESREIGTAALGFFNAVVPIVSAVPIEEQVRDALLRALRVHDVLAEDPSGAAYRIALLVDRFGVTEHVTGSSPEHSRACVAYDVLVRDSAGALRFAKEFESRVVTESTWADTTSANGPALRQALRETLDQLFADAEFAALFSPSAAYPEAQAETSPGAAGVAAPEGEAAPAAR